MPEKQDLYETLVRRLETFADKEKIRPIGFDCPSYAHCNRDTGGKLQRGRSITMSCVGKGYASAAVKLVFIGLDHGKVENRGDDGWDFRKHRVQMLNDFGKKGSWGSCAYMRGVAKCAVEILRPLECTACLAAGCQGSDSCVLDQVTRCNLVKCAQPRDMTYVATGAMEARCGRILMRELSVLRPTLCIVLSKGIRARVRGLFGESGWQSHDIAVFGGCELAEVQSAPPDSFRCHVGYLYQPAFNQLYRHWQNGALRVFDALRSLSVIP